MASELKSGFHAFFISIYVQTVVICSFNAVASSSLFPLAWSTFMSSGEQVWTENCCFLTLALNQKREISHETHFRWSKNACYMFEHWHPELSWKHKISVTVWNFSFNEKIWENISRCTFSSFITSLFSKDISVSIRIDWNSYKE